MANPWVHFEDQWDGETLTLTTGTAASGFPHTNIQDWRLGTAYRFKGSSTTSNYIVTVDVGVGNTISPDTAVVGGHNLSTAGALWSVWYSDDGAAYTSITGNQTPTDDLPDYATWTAEAHRYWRFFISNQPFSEAPQVGIFTLGRRLDFEHGALMGLDPYQEDVVVEDAANENGSPIGVNVRYKRKFFQIAYGGGNDPGFSDSGFFTKSGVNFDTDFVTHAINNAKPFWFAWNTDEDTSVYLCKTRRVNEPFVGTTNRRSLIAEFEAFREVS